MSIGYRTDIQGLRGIAVILVLLFHYNNTLFSIGHVGVDVFFIISGYVISKVLREKYLSKSGAGVISFYKNRFFRIYPALAVCTLISIIFYYLFGETVDLISVNLTAATSLLFLSNIFLQIKNADYFAIESSNILEHTWSLSIEFQYYIIFPIFLLILFRLISKKWIGVMLLGISCILLFSQIGREYSNADYFSIPFRFSQLLLGCSTYFIVSTPFNSKFNLMYFSVLAFGILLFSMYVSPIFHAVFYESLLASIITVIIIIQQNSQIIKILSFPVLTFVGEISYSIYLYHLPVIILISLYNIQYDLIISVFIILTLSYLSYRFIEKPFSNLNLLISSSFLKNFSMLSASVFLLFSFFVLLFFVRKHIDFPMSEITKRVLQKSDIISKDSSGFRTSMEKATSRISSFIYDINYIDSTIIKYNIKERSHQNWYVKDKLSSRMYCQPNSDEFTLNKYNLRDECSSKKLSENDDFFLLSGNSHAEHYLPMFNNSKLINSYYVFPVGSCSSDNNNSICAKDLLLRTENIKKFITRSKRSFIVLPFYDIKTFKFSIELMSDLINIDNVSVIVLRPTPRIPDFKTIYGIASFPCFSYGKNCSFNKNNVKSYNQADYDFDNLVNPILSKYRKKIYIFDPAQQICKNEICSLYDKVNNILFYHDGHHLSNEGSSFQSKYFDNFLFPIISKN